MNTIAVASLILRHQGALRWGEQWELGTLLKGTSAVDESVGERFFSYWSGIEPDILQLQVQGLNQ